MADNVLSAITPQLKAPDRKIIGLDPGTNSLIDSSIARGQQTPDQFAQQSLSGVPEAGAKAQLSDEQGAQEDARSGYTGSAINQAIRNQYNAQSGANIQRLQSAYSQNAIFQKNAALQQASAQAMARQNVTTQSYQKLMEAYNNTETARAQLLSAVLGAGGTVAGMAAGSPKKKGNGSPLTGAATNTNASADTYSSNDTAIA